MYMDLICIRSRKRQDPRSKLRAWGRRGEERKTGGGERRKMQSSVKSIIKRKERSLKLKKV